jgi:hypothetical protein
MKKLLILISVFLFAFIPEQASAQVRLSDIGVEFQAYPAGLQPGIRADLGLGQRENLNLRVGYNFVNRRNWGVHFDEYGGGPGFSLGYRHYFQDGQSGLFLGGRTDFWFVDIDWVDEGPLGLFGTTETVILQPTVEGGWLFQFAGKKLAIAPNLAFGREINIVTKGEEVGQGWIFLAGFMFTKRFGK